MPLTTGPFGPGPRSGAVGCGLAAVGCGLGAAAAGLAEAFAVPPPLPLQAAVSAAALNSVIRARSAGRPAGMQLRLTSFTELGQQVEVLAGELDVVGHGGDLGDSD